MTEVLVSTPEAAWIRSFGLDDLTAALDELIAKGEIVIQDLQGT